MHAAPLPYRKHSSSLFSLLAFLLVTFLPGHALARESSIPDELQQWIPWVLYEQEEEMCSLESGEGTKRYCTWPSRLALSVNEKGGSFSQDWTVESKSLVPLPGNSPLWSAEVQVNGKDILVSRLGDRPALWLDPGEYRVTGIFAWKEMPEHIVIPPATGLVSLTLLGRKVSHPQLDSQGRLWFKQKKKTKKDIEDSLSVQVFRRIIDGVPLLQQLHIQLTVSGSPRQVSLGLVGDENFVPLRYNSSLPLRLDARGRLELQVRPGQYRIQLTLRNTAPLSPEALSPGTIDGPWPTEEIWVFAADPKLRQVEITGVAAVDPSRTSLPGEWKNLPAYLLKRGDAMGFTLKNKGNPSPVPNHPQLQRGPRPLPESGKAVGRRKLRPLQRSNDGLYFIHIHKTNPIIGHIINCNNGY